MNIVLKCTDGQLERSVLEPASEGYTHGVSQITVDSDVKFELGKEYQVQINKMPEEGAKIQTTELPFEEALRLVKQGAAIRRTGWNGKGLCVKSYYPNGDGGVINLPYLYIEYPDGRRCPWLASQTDIMESDWEVFSKHNSQT